MRHFLIYVNQNKDTELAVTNRIREYLESRDCKVTLKVTKADWKEGRRGGTGAEQEIPADADCIVVLGGDGTVLQAARESRKLLMPIIGVNLGTMGYLTEIEPANLEEALDRLIRDDYTKESRMMIKGRIQFSDGSEEEGWALNDIVITRNGPLRVISMDLYVNGQFLHRYSADGMIVTTPTGSTGYSLSAGGPLIEPGARLITLTPICAHSLGQRSIVLSPDDVIEIEIPAGREGQDQTMEASFDGSQRVAVRTGDRIRIARSEKTTEFVRMNQVNFMEVLHKKFSE